MIASVTKSPLGDTHLLAEINQRLDAFEKRMGTQGSTPTNPKTGPIKSGSDQEYDDTVVRKRAKNERGMYSTVNANRTNIGASFAIGQNEATQIGEYAGYITPYGEWWLAIRREDGFRVQRVPGHLVPEGTIGWNGESFRIKTIGKNGESIVKDYPRMVAPGELMVCGSVKADYLDLTKIYQLYHQHALHGDIDSALAQEEAEKEKKLSIQETHIYEKISGSLLKRGFLYLRDDEKVIFENQSEKDKIKMLETGLSRIPKSTASHLSKITLEGEYYTTHMVSKMPRPVVIGDYLVQYKKDLSGHYLDKNGNIIKINPQTGEYDPNGTEWFTVVKEGDKVYLADPNKPFLPKIINGEKVEMKGAAEITIVREGLYDGSMGIIDPRTKFLDEKDVGLGFTYENHFCINTCRVLQFKSEKIEHNSARFNEIKKLLEEQNGRVEAKPRGYFTDPKDGKKYLMVWKRNFDVKKPDSKDDPRALGYGNDFYCYELDANKQPIPEYKIPEIGMNAAFYRWGRTSEKVYQHAQRFFQAGRSDAQSDGPSEVATSVLWHGRLIDRVSGEYMLKYFEKAFGPIHKKDFLPDTKFNVGQFNNKDWGSLFYRAARRTSQYHNKTDRHGYDTDNIVTLQWEYSLARGLGDFFTGSKRLWGGFKESSLAATTGAGVTTAALAIAGGLASPILMGVAATTAFLFSGLAWYSMAYQHSRKRKDIVELEEMDRYADTSGIYSDHETLIWDKKKGNPNHQPKQMTNFNLVGLYNDLYATFRGACGALYILSGGAADLAEEKRKASTYTYATVLTGSLSGAAVTASMTGIAAGSLAIASGIGAAALGAAALGTGLKALWHAAKYSLATRGKKYAKDRVEEFQEFKDYHLSVYNEDTVTEKDTRVRTGYRRRPGAKGIDLDEVSAQIG